ncbi:hypothetical protein JCM39194_20260 [Desulfotomaculum varum]
MIDLLTPEHNRKKKKYNQDFKNIWKSCGLCVLSKEEGLPELIEFEELKTEKVFYFQLPYGLIPDDFITPDKEKRVAWAMRAKEVKIDEDNHKHLLIVKVAY